MPYIYRSSAKWVLAGFGILFLLTWGSAQTRRLQDDSERKTAGATSVKGMKLKVSANGRYFVGQDGKPFFYLGDTCWLLFQRLNRDEVEEYLKERAAKGFTVIQAYVAGDWFLQGFHASDLLSRGRLPQVQGFRPHYRPPAGTLKMRSAKDLFQLPE